MSDYFYPNTDLKVCFNCKHFISVIDLGQGLRCRLSANKTSDNKLLLLPSRYHSCPQFMRKQNLINNDDFRVREDSLVTINKLIEKWSSAAAEQDCEPESITISFNFSTLGRTLTIKPSGSSQEILIEDLFD